MRLSSRICPALWATVSCLAGVLLITSCTSLRNEVDPSLLGVESAKLVVSSFLSPQDTTLAVKVTRSSTVVGDSLSLLQTGNNVTDAIVTLSEGSKSVVLPYNNRPADDPDRTRPYYSISARLLPIVAGHTYTLSVVTANGQRTSSTCTIPVPVQLKSITFDSTTENQGRSQSRRYFVLSDWQDPAGQANYYQVAGYFRYVSGCPTCLTSQPGNFPLTFDDDNRGLLSDAGLDGTVMVSGKAFATSSSFTSNQTTNFFSQYRTATVTVNLMSVDQAYYQFQQAVIRQRRVRNNPFAEPVLVPSNIQGGLGCFAGYNNATVTLRLK